MTLKEQIDSFRKGDNDEIAEQLTDWLEELAELRTAKLKNSSALLSLDDLINRLKTLRTLGGSLASVKEVTDIVNTTVKEAP